LEQILKFDAEDVFELLRSPLQDLMFDYSFELRKQSVLQEGEGVEKPWPEPK
jgi:hypothetical protein